MDDDSILGTQGQIVLDMIEMLFDGVVLQESVVNYICLSFNAFDNFIIIMGISVSSSKITLRHSKVHLLPTLCNRSCERLSLPKGTDLRPSTTSNPDFFMLLFLTFSTFIACFPPSGDGCLLY